MTAVATAPAFRMQPLRAARALRRLLADKEDTAQVFEIMRALNGKATPRGYDRLISTMEGGRIAFERRELVDRLDDRAWLASLPEGSVGRAYAAFMAEENLTAQGLTDASVQASGALFQSPHPYAWYSRRIRDSHDLWHVLTGYGRDILGEACVVAFSHAQTRSLGFGVIAVAGAGKLSRINPGWPFATAVRQAWRAGRACAWLPAQDYDALLAEPLQTARIRLGLSTPTVYLSIPPDVRNGRRPSQVPAAAGERGVSASTASPPISSLRAWLLGVATAVPPHTIEQDVAAAAAAEAFKGQVFRTPDLLAIFANTGIKRRRTAMPMDWYAQPRSWPERNDAYLAAADALYVEAAEKALAAAGVKAADVGTVVTVSTTGIATPSLEARLHGRLGFAAGVKRVPVFGLGCAGGVSGLAIARRMALAEPGRAVLLVVVELCSLSVRGDAPTKANIVATALFGDGAAAAVLRAEVEPPAPRPWGGARPVEADAQHLWPETLDIMGWTVDPVGFGIVLAPTLPAFVQGRFGEAMEGFGREAQAFHERHARYVCHPGGARVLPALEGVMGLPEGTLDVEREVLADYGNMSAPTVFFVLERVLAKSESGPLTMAALGPGFTASFAALGAAAPGPATVGAGA